MEHECDLTPLMDAFSGNMLLWQFKLRKWCPRFGSHSEQVGKEFGIAMLLRPKIKRYGGKLVNNRLGEAVPGEVDGFHVGLAAVAAFDANVRKGFGSVNRKLGVVFLTAAGTYDAAKLPFGETEATEQVSSGAIAQWAEDA